MDIVTGLEMPARTVEAYLKQENRLNGLLSDVSSITSSYKSIKPVDPPCIWIIEHPIEPTDQKSSNLSSISILKSTFEFVCVEYDSDPDIAGEKSKNLATRVGATILKHFNRIKARPTDPDMFFQSVRFNRLIPDGKVEIRSKGDTIPVSSIILEFIHRINWLSGR